MFVQRLFLLLIHHCLYVCMSVYHPNGDHESDYPSHGDIGNIIHVVNLSVSVPHSIGEECVFHAGLGALLPSAVDSQWIEYGYYFDGL